MIEIVCHNSYIAFYLTNRHYYGEIDHNRKMAYLRLNVRWSDLSDSRTLGILVK
jgi:hypothetical protein